MQASEQYPVLVGHFRQRGSVQMHLENSCFAITDLPSWSSLGINRGNYLQLTCLVDPAPVANEDGFKALFRPALSVT